MHTCARFTLKALAIFLMMSFGTDVYALPAGGVVTAGSASISGGAASTTITQSTQNAAINWQSFNIEQRESVRFVQPNSNSVALNRVLGSDPSSIMGSLSANGKVFLLNPNGILFGREAQVNVGGLVASTLNITDGDFMAGRYQFTGSNNGTILNQGSITADGGYVALLGANVSNEGVISAKLGTVAIAAGNAVTLDVAGDGLLNVTVNQGAVNTLAQNGGLIRADGGQVLLTARAAGNLLQGAVNNSGVIEAQTVENHNGTIRLLGDMQSGTVNVRGTLDASGTGAGQTGGSVTITGNHVSLFDQAKIDVSGDTGGGTVLVGGDLRGANAAVQNASATYMSADATITADAITKGSGGKVVLWANDVTRAYGSITARGGAQSGDGGLIETSGHWLDVAGINVNAGAPSGKGGIWLLDPADVTITGAATSGGTFAGGVFSPDATVATANVNVATITTALAAGTDVTINTANASGSGSGDITVDSAVTWTKAPGVVPASTLTLTAVRDVTVNQAITATWGNLVATAVRDVTLYAPVTTTDGSFTSTAGRDVNIVKDGTHTLTAVTTTRGDLKSNAGHNVNVTTASLTMTTGNVVLSAGNDGTGGGAVVFAAGTPPVAVTGPTSSAKIYSPIGVTTDYSGNFTLTGGATLAQYSYVFAVGLTGATGATGAVGPIGPT